MIDIYEALKSGQTPDAIAQAFVDELNAAIAKQDADRAAAEEAARAQAQKDKDTQAVVDCINGYLAVYYPTLKPIDATWLEDTIAASQAANEIIDGLKTNKPIEIILDDVFGDFFKKNGI